MPGESHARERSRHVTCILSHFLYAYFLLDFLPTDALHAIRPSYHFIEFSYLLLSGFAS